MRNLQAIARIQPLPAVHGGAPRDFVELAFISALFLAVLFVSGCATMAEERMAFAEKPSKTARQVLLLENREPTNTNR